MTAQDETVLINSKVGRQKACEKHNSAFGLILLTWFRKKGGKKANILKECVKCAAWEERLDTCGCLRDMRSCQGF